MCASTGVRRAHGCACEYQQRGHFYYTISPIDGVCGRGRHHPQKSHRRVGDSHTTEPLVPTCGTRPSPLSSPNAGLVCHSTTRKPTACAAKRPVACILLRIWGGMVGGAVSALPPPPFTHYLCPFTIQRSTHARRSTQRYVMTVHMCRNVDGHAASRCSWQHSKGRHACAQGTGPRGTAIRGGNSVCNCNCGRQADSIQDRK